MKLFVLTLNFRDEEDANHVFNFVRVYSTEALAKQALKDAQDEYGQSVDYSISHCTLDKDV